MDNIMDPELATEMVKLLGQELKVVRAQLRESERRTSTPSMIHERAQQLVLENDTIKAENTALQEMIEKLQDTLAQSSYIKSEELPGPLQHAESTSHMSEELARLLAENEDLNHEKEKALQIQAELSSLQEKYQRSKGKVREYKEVLKGLRGELSNYTKELEQLRKTVVSEIDCGNFLEGLPYQPIEGQSELSLIQSYARGGGGHVKFPKDVLDACTGDGLFIINCHEVVWSLSGIALGLVIKPTFQYNPKTQGGTWTEFQDRFEAGKRMDLCYLSGNTIRYLGTYERAADQATMVVAPNTLQHLDSTKLEYASRRTILSPELVPPIQTQMINNMYMQGVIKLQCFVIRCVTINQAFAEKLRETLIPLMRQKPSDSAAIPRSEVTNGSNPKRKRSPKPTTPSTRTKKR